MSAWAELLKSLARVERNCVRAPGRTAPKRKPVRGTERSSSTSGRTAPLSRPRPAEPPAASARPRTEPRPFPSAPLLGLTSGPRPAPVLLPAGPRPAAPVDLSTSMDPRAFLARVKARRDAELADATEIAPLPPGASGAEGLRLDTRPGRCIICDGPLPKYRSKLYGSLECKDAYQETAGRVNKQAARDAAALLVLNGIEATPPPQWTAPPGIPLHDWLQLQAEVA